MPFNMFWIRPAASSVGIPGARRIKGYETAEIIGKHFECFYSAEDRAAGIPAAGPAHRRSRREVRDGRMALRKDGTRFWANCDHRFHQRRRSARRLRQSYPRHYRASRDGKPDLRQAQKMEAVGQFTGGAAHDFNNLLMAILGSLEILRKRMPNDPRLLALLDTAVLGAKRGSSLTQRMLAFARRQELNRRRWT